MSFLFLVSVVLFLVRSMCVFSFCHRISSHDRIHVEETESIRGQILVNDKTIIKGAVYTVWIFICICMSLRVFLFAKINKFLTKGGIHCISEVFPWHFCFMREHSLVELTEHDDSAADINLNKSYT